MIILTEEKLEKSTLLFIAHKSKKLIFDLQLLNKISFN